MLDYFVKFSFEKVEQQTLTAYFVKIKFNQLFLKWLSEFIVLHVLFFITFYFFFSFFLQHNEASISLCNVLHFFKSRRNIPD